MVSGEWRPLDGEARLLEVGKVPPSVRGCACQEASGEPNEAAAWLVLAFGMAALRRRRSPPAKRASLGFPPRS